MTHNNGEENVSNLGGCFIAPEWRAKDMKQQDSGKLEDVDWKNGGSTQDGTRNMRSQPNSS